MSCSSKYQKLVEYLKTHYTYQLKLNSFAIGNNEEVDAKVRREVYGNIMDFVENLETQEEIENKHKNNLIPIDFSATQAADSVSIDCNFTTDAVTFGSATTYPVTLGGPDTINIGTPLPGGMGEDHITLEPKYYSDEHGLGAG